MLLLGTSAAAAEEDASSLLLLLGTRAAAAEEGGSSFLLRLGTRGAAVEEEEGSSFLLVLSEEKALVCVEEVYEVPVELLAAPHLGQQAGLPGQHALQLINK